jgi:hypothetical protein
VSDADAGKFDADIFGLGVDVAVDNIVYLRLIIQGYLEGAYGYSRANAALLARYVTIYNAVFRGDMSYFDSKYKRPVMGNLVRERAGLSIRFDEWPGQTLMVIPLGPASAGPLNAVSTIPLTDPRVIEEVDQEDKTAMAELIVDQIEEIVQRIENPPPVQPPTQQPVQPTTPQSPVQPDPGNEAPPVDPTGPGSGTNPDDDLGGYLGELEDAGDILRGTIAGGQEAEIARDPPPPIMQGLLGASILSQNNSLGRLVTLDSNNLTIINSSLLRSINIRSLNAINNRLIAIAEDASVGAVRLVEMNPNTLDLIKQGEDEMNPDSLIWASGNEFYAITSTDGNFYLARYNLEFVRQARSSIPVHRFASILIIDNYIVTQRADGSAVLLNINNLSERR